MKKIGVIAGLLMAVSLAAAGLGCSAQEEQANTVPPRNSVSPPAPIEISYDDFMKQNSISRSVEVTLPASLIVSLGGSPSTGFQWQEIAKISDQTIMSQYEHNYVPPQSTGAVGVPGKDVWTFKSLKKGTTTVSMEYSRPWEGGEKGQWTFTLNVTVK